MLALSPLFSVTGGWRSEDHITHHHNDDQLMFKIDYNNNDFNGGARSLTNQYMINIDDYTADHAPASFASTYIHSISNDDDQKMMNPLHHDQYNYEQEPACNQIVDHNNYIIPPAATTSAAADIIHAHHDQVDNNNNNKYGMIRDDDDDDDDEQLYTSPQFTRFNVGARDPEDVNPVTKKQNHNASERDRRRKINTLYSSLRHLLPASNLHKKKLSIPETISRALKYIPGLQQELETLIQKKEKLSRRTNIQVQLEKPTRKNGSLSVHDDQQECGPSSLLSSVSANQLGENEIVVQISASKYFDHASRPLDISEVLLQLENDGFNVLNVSSSESCGGRIFYNLHLWVEGANAIKSGWLTDKIVSLYEN